MACLTNIPSDILLRVLYMLEVTDMLCLERTCTYLRDIISTRHLWLIKLEGLDQTCAPDFPPDADFTKLTYTQLREAVIRAIQLYHFSTREDSPRADYELRRTITPWPPNPYPTDDRRWFISKSKVSPDLRYLVVTWSVIEPAEEDTKLIGLCIYDLEDVDRCIWTYGFMHGSFDGMIYTFEVCKDGSITLALDTAELNNTDEYTHHIQLFRIAPTTMGIVTQSQEINIADLVIPSDYEVAIALNNDFAFFYYFSSRETIETIAMCVNWRTNRSVMLYSGNFLLCVRFHKDRLFFCETNKDRLHQSICSLSVMEALSLDEAHSSKAMIDINQLEIDRLPLELPDDRVSRIIDSMQCSIHDWPRNRDTPKLTFSIIITATLRTHNSDIRLATYQASFDPQASGTARWTLIKSQRYLEHPEGPSLFQTTMTRSGRVLMTVLAERTSSNGFVGDSHWHESLVVLDKDGLLHFPRLSENTYSSDGSRYAKPDILDISMEEYSNVLVSTWEDSSVELYYPSLKMLHDSEGNKEVGAQCIPARYHDRGSFV